MSNEPNDTKQPLGLNKTPATAPAKAEASRRIMTDARARATINDGTASTFHVNKDKIPDDVEYRWVRVMVKGENDDDNYDKALIKGWLEVPASRHPELVLHKMGRARNDDVDSEEPIKRKGHILMDIPKTVAVAARDQQREENAMRVQSIEHTLLDGAAPTQFFTQKNDVTMSKGVSFQN